MNDAPSKTSESRGNIRDELVIDIYANPTVDGLAVLVDRPFRSPLVKFEVDTATKDLIFVFKERRLDLGMPLKDELLPFFLNRKFIEVYQVDMKTKNPLNGWRIPLSIVGQS